MTACFTGEVVSRFAAVEIGDGVRRVAERPRRQTWKLARVPVGKRHDDAVRSET